MGCSQSTMESKEAVNQCKERKAFIKQSISGYHAFAAAHFAYAAALKNTGAALSDYAQGELQFRDHLRNDSLPPPPHSDSRGFKDRSNTIRGIVNEVPNHGSEHRSNDKSSVSGDSNREIGKDNGIVPWDFFFTSMEGVVFAEVDDKSSRIGKSDIQRTTADCNSGRHRAVVESEREPPLASMKEDVQSMKLLRVIKELDDGFVKASGIAHEVSNILEASMLHCDSNSTDNSSWKHLFKGHQIGNDEEENYAPKEEQTHYMILDNILAWEKKLYDEVKAGEEMRYVYKKKIASLNKLTKRGASSDSLMRTKVMVSHLHTRCIVQMQSIDSTVSKINHLRDEQLYPKLVQLGKEMDAMWKKIGKQHENQAKMLQELFAIEFSQLPNNTREHNLNNTHQLHVHVKIWCSEFQKIIVHQKEYIKSLHNWLKLNLISIDYSLRDNISSPQKPQNPKINSLLRTWQDQFEKLPEEGIKTAINTFAAAIDTIIRYQSDVMQMKERCEETRREITRKSRKFEEWCDKHIAKTTPTDEYDPGVVDDIEVIAEHQIVVEALKRRLEEEEEEAYRRQCVQVKDKSLMNLKSGLPEIFAAMSEFSRACSHMYGSLTPQTRASIQMEVPNIIH
ncbi:hypothetical protein LXL04_032123 [Taraxacum kok-saghyz]